MSPMHSAARADAKFAGDGYSVNGIDAARAGLLLPEAVPPSRRVVLHRRARPAAHALALTAPRSAVVEAAAALPVERAAQALVGLLAARGHVHERPPASAASSSAAPSAAASAAPGVALGKEDLDPIVVVEEAAAYTQQAAPALPDRPGTCSCASSAAAVARAARAAAPAERDVRVVRRSAAVVDAAVDAVPARRADLRRIRRQGGSVSGASLGGGGGVSVQCVDQVRAPVAQGHRRPERHT